MTQRALTGREKEFVKQAQAGNFGVYFAADGTPHAMGATGTDNLFDADLCVVETDDHFNNGSIYSLAPDGGLSS
jgi:hypothetical protein